MLIAIGAADNWVGVNPVYGPENAGQGNVISGNSNQGVWIESAGTTGNVVAGNDIGTTAAGTAALANGVDGVLINSGASATTIGGTVAGARNIISGNGTHGVEIDSPATDNLVEGNYIGTDITGTVALGNGVSGGSAGVYVSGGGNTFGGNIAGAGNVIAGSGNYGIRFTSSAATGNLVEGNEIGTNAAGTAALPNANNGINIDGGSSDNTIGGTAAGAGNVISGNSGDGVEITGTGTIDNVVSGNLVGTNAAGTAALANTGLAGIMIYDSNSNTIGGTAAGARNVISGNAGNGIQLNPDNVTSPFAEDNLIEGNFIGVNASGMALGNGGDGIFAFYATGNTIGGTAAGAGNIFAGNNFFGVEIDFSSQNLVAGNLVGITESGSAVANGDGGVSLGSASGNTIGGSASARATSSRATPRMGSRSAARRRPATWLRVTISVQTSREPPRCPTAPTAS